MTRSQRFDVVIAGASLAGCSTAMLFGKTGLQVALVDKHSSPDAFKRLCGHYIQASATPVLDRLGISEEIEKAGGVRNGLDFSTRWGVIASPLPVEERAYGYSLQREKLDPMIRAMAADVPSVTYMPGQRVTALVSDDGVSPNGVEVEDRDGRTTNLVGRLLVGADGRSSKVAELGKAKEHRAKNNRFCYASYFTGVGVPKETRGRLWFREPNISIAAPQDDGLTLLAVFGHKRYVDDFNKDRVKALWAIMDDLPGIDMSNARIEDEVIGYKNYDLISRRPVIGSKAALVGDAALASDPSMGVGCGWAFQAAAWLADSVTQPLAEERDLSAGLKQYRRLHRKNLRGHHMLLVEDAKARPLNPVQRLLFSVGVSDPVTAQLLSEFAQRTVPPSKLLGPKTLARAGWQATVGTRAAA